jgi:aryl-alcohol dehydrogenase-like predicted oxidoreductase
MGIGLAALGRPGYLNVGHGVDVGGDHSVRALRDRAFEVLDGAYESGVRWFDTARSYGRGEEFLGSWLRRRGIVAGDVTVSSKWGYRYTADWEVDADVHEVKDLSLAHLRRQLPETREHLGDYLSVYQIHSATIDSGVLADEGVLSFLADMRDGGTRVGLSTSGVGQAEVIDLARLSGAFDTVQSTWNLLERSAGQALGKARDAGMTVIVKEGLANGRLTARGDVTGFAAAARTRGLAPDALALAAVLAQPWSDVVLSGAATVGQLRENLAARDVGFDDDLDAALAGLAEEPGEYWRRRSALQWT